MRRRLRTVHAGEDNGVLDAEELGQGRGDGLGEGGRHRARGWGRWDV